MTRSVWWMLVAHELRSVVRDTKTVATTVLLPLVVIPLMLIAGRATTSARAEVAVERPHPYAVTGPHAARARRDLERVATTAAVHLRERGSPEPEVELEAGTLDAFVRAEADDEGVVYTVVFHGDRETSQAAGTALRDRLEDAQVARRWERLARTPGPPDRQAWQQEDVAAPGEARGARWGRFAVLALTWLVLMGGQVVAADVVAGEKERRTLETLLTTAASRRAIVLAKLTAIATVAAVITAINLGNVAFYGALGWVPGIEPGGAALAWPTLLWGTALVLPLVGVVSGLLLGVSGLSNSYKEAQLLSFGLSLALLVPCAASLLPSLPLRSAVLVVPIANAAVAVRELTEGTVDALGFGVTILVNLLAGAGLVAAVVALLDQERLTTHEGTAEERRRSPAAFSVDVLRWCAAIWALYLLVQLGLGAIDLRVQLLLNLIVILLGSACLLAWYYRLDWRAAFAWRRPRVATVIAAVLGAPAGLVVVSGLTAAASRVLPVPPEIARSFAEAMLPADLPRWQLFVLGALLPGICEELFFRGLLRHGLAPRMRPWVSWLCTAAIFALFHVALFRLVPTFALGVWLAAITWRTGNIVPAMVWHATHNATALAWADDPRAASLVLPGWAYAVGVAVLVGCWAVLSRGAGPPPPSSRRSDRPA